MIKFEFNPFKQLGVELPEGADKRDALEGAAEFLREKVIEYMGQGNSPVAGYRKFPALSKDYKREKVSQGGAPIPNLELAGDLKDAIEVYVKGNRIGLKITGKEGKKADGHCNHSGESELPLRRFVPDSEEDETWKKSILQGIGRIIESGG